jgi:hypothetical protein
MPLSHACDLGQHADCGGNGDMFGCTCDCHLPPDAELCELCGEQGTDANPVGLVADPTSSDGRLTVCETCNRA